MARPSTLDYNAIKKEIEQKGVIVESVDTLTGRLAIQYKCTNCGETSKMNYVNYQKGQNPNFYCKKCQKLKGPKMERIQSYFDSVGVKITRVQMDEKHWEIYFPCSRCGAEAKILDDYVGKNNKELCCAHCRDNTRVPTQEEIEQEFSSRGSELLSKYVNFHTPVKFRCTKCCGVGEIDLAHLRNGVNPNLLCKSCIKVDTVTQLKNTLKSKNSKQLGDFVNVETPVLVSCSCCGTPFKFHFGNYKYTGTNKDILCPNCYTLARRKPVDPDVQKLRESAWNTYVKEFYNLPRDEWKNFRAHHINKVSEFAEYRSSVTNGYPLPVSEHDSAGRDKFYHYGPGVNIANWDSNAKLSYHNYPDFHFNDFNSKFIMEVINPSSSIERSELYKKKVEFNARGIFYMPVFLDELSTELKRQLIYSMIRNRLYKDFPDVYEYTGTTLKRFYARKLKCTVIEKKQANVFFEMNHVQGAKSSQVNLGLIDENTGALLCCMGLSKPRFNAEFEWEIDRLATRFDSVVVGGASKLFSYFVKEYAPSSIMTFCDLRFCSLDHTETIYSKLGFEFAGRSYPNYWYRDPRTNSLVNRLYFQKSMLNDKLEIFDPNLSEFQNMEMNGYVRIFDCGNYKYVWRKPE